MNEGFPTSSKPDHLGEHHDLPRPILHQGCRSRFSPSAQALVAVSPRVSGVWQLRGAMSLLGRFSGAVVPARRERAELPRRALFQAPRSAGRGVAGMDARFTPRPSGVSRGRFVECYGASPVRLMRSYATPAQPLNAHGGISRTRNRQAGGGLSALRPRAKEL